MQKIIFCYWKNSKIPKVPSSARQGFSAAELWRTYAAADATSFSLTIPLPPKKVQCHSFFGSEKKLCQGREKIFSHRPARSLNERNKTSPRLIWNALQFAQNGIDYYYKVCKKVTRMTLRTQHWTVLLYFAPSLIGQEKWHCMRWGEFTQVSGHPTRKEFSKGRNTRSKKPLGSAQSAQGQWMHHA